MKKLLLCLFITSLTTLQLSTQAMAADYYIEGKVGVSHIRKLDSEFEGKLKNSSQISVAAGKYLNDKFSLGLNIAYNPEYKYHADTIGNGQWDKGMLYTHDGKVKSLAATMDGYYYLNGITSRVSPYVGLGAGVAWNTMSDREITGSGVFHSTRYGSTTNNFAWNVMAGARIKINGNFSLNCEYRYADLGKLKTGNSRLHYNGKVDSPEVSSTKFRTHAFLVGLRYDF